MFVHVCVCPYVYLCVVCYVYVQVRICWCVHMWCVYTVRRMGRRVYVCLSVYILCSMCICDVYVYSVYMCVMCICVCVYIHVSMCTCIRGCV